MEAPCHTLSIDGEDIMGNMDLDIQQGLEKLRVIKQGGRREVHFSNELPLDSEDLLASFKSGEGCRIRGHFLVHNVPGSFHVSTHSREEAMQVLKDNGFNLRMSHEVTHLSFGPQKLQSEIKQTF